MVFLVYQVSYTLFLDENENMTKHGKMLQNVTSFSDAFLIKIATASGAAKDNVCYLHKTEKLKYQLSDLSQSLLKKLPRCQVIAKSLF